MCIWKKPENIQTSKSSFRATRRNNRNLEQIAHGQTESPLNHRGIKQATETAGMLVNWQEATTYICQPTVSAQHTADIADALNLSLQEDLKKALWVTGKKSVTRN